ncbi:MAG: hemolysin family protein [Candidatus Acidiferrales bacterium]
MIALQLFAVLVLVGLNGFFAATEFSLVAVRLSRVRQLVEQGDPRAKIVEALLGDLGRVVSGVQVGITLASLMLGYLGEVTLATVLTPLVRIIPLKWAIVAAHTAAFALAFGLLTVLQVVLGELVPKSLSLARAERVALIVARPFSWFLTTFRWAIDLLDDFADRFVGWLGVASAQSHTLVRSVEELQVMMQQARDRGLFPAHEAKLIQNAMELGQIQVREIVIPRPDVHAVPIDSTLEETMRVFASTQRSRLPVYEGTLDHILGFVHIKDMIWVLLERARGTDEGTPVSEFSLRSFVRDALIVPETKSASELLVEFRARRTELAMVVDEFGSILGVVTLEDIMEQMVGEIHDEFDVVERPVFLPDGAMVVDGALNVRDLESQYGVNLPEDGSYETVGGFVLSQLGFIPRGGESFEAGGYRFTVMEMERRRVSRVKIKPVPVAQPTTPEAVIETPGTKAQPSSGGGKTAGSSHKAAAGGAGRPPTRSGRLRSARQGRADNVEDTNEDTNEEERRRA